MFYTYIFLKELFHIIYDIIYIKHHVLHVSNSDFIFMCTIVYT